MQGRAFWTAGYLLLGLTPAIAALRVAVEADIAISLILVATGLLLGVGGWILVLRRTPPFQRRATFAARLGTVGRALLFAFVGAVLGLVGVAGNASLSDRARFDPDFHASPAAAIAIALLVLPGTYMVLLGLATALVRTVKLRA